MKSLMIQGTSSGAVKTTLVAALCRIFSDKGYRVAPFKSQNMSNFAYITPNFEISRPQAIQAIAARCDITPDLNPILLKQLGNYYSMVYLCGKRYKKMTAKEYYGKFVNSEGIKTAFRSLKTLQKNFDLIILEDMLEAWEQSRINTLDELYKIFVSIHKNVKNRFSDEAFLKLGKVIYDKFIIEKEAELAKLKDE